MGINGVQQNIIWTLYLGLLNEFYPTGKVLTISIYFVAASDCFLITFRFFAPNKSATLLLGAMNNASIPFNTLLNVAVKAALGAPRWLWRIEYWDGIRDTNFHIVMVQLPAFPRDLKRRSRTSPWCRIVRRCPGCTDSSKEPSVQPSFGRVPKYPICHICRYHGAHWSHPGWLRPPTLHTCDSHRVSIFLNIFGG